MNNKKYVTETEKNVIRQLGQKKLALQSMFEMFGKDTIEMKMHCMKRSLMISQKQISPFGNGGTMFLKNMGGSTVRKISGR